MLSLLSRFVVGEIRDEGDSDSQCYADTDEEVLVPAMPIINIEQTEVGQDVLAHSPAPCFTPTSDSSEEPAGKDETPLELPPPETCRRVQELVEYYLSEHNLVKDMFMLKHVTKHREGYVSLKLLATYKKVKHLTKDWRVVAHALKDSEALELNSEGTKVRRSHPLPNELDEETRPFRTLLAVEVTQDLANMNALAEFFGKFGDMVSLQMHKPGGRVLPEVRNAEKGHPGISNTVCALVEFEKVHQARQAFRVVFNGPECGLKVIEVPRKRRDCGGSGGGSLLNIKCQTEGESAYYSTSDFSEPPSPVNRVRVQRLRSPCSPTPSPKIGRRGSFGQQQLSSPESTPPSPFSPRRRVPTPGSSPEEHPLTPQDLYPRRASPCSSPQPRRRRSITFTTPTPDSPCLSRFHVASPEPQSISQEADAPQLSPWLRRRVLAGTASPLASPLASPSLRRRLEASVLLPDNVTRLPRGPDGSKGFIGRRIPISVEA